MYAAKFSELREDTAGYLGEIVAEDKESLRDLVSEMVEIREHEGAILEEGNALIEHLQKDPCGLFNAKGAFIPHLNQVNNSKFYRLISL